MKPAEYYQRDRTRQPPALTPDYKTSVARSPRYSMISLQQSVSEITGPVFGHNDIDPIDNDLIKNYAKDQDPIGERIIVHGRVLDENARPVPNTLVEIWQANASGRYRHKKDIHVSVFGSSFSQRLITQLYFEGDPLIPLCPIVATIPDPDAIQQLIARLDMNATVPLDCIAYKFDIVLRGRRSTLLENRLEGN